MAHKVTHKIKSQPLFFRLILAFPVIIFTLLLISNRAQADKLRAHPMHKAQTFCETHYFLRLLSQRFAQGDAIYTDLTWKTKAGLPVPQKIVIKWQQIHMPLQRMQNRPYMFQGLIGISPKTKPGIHEIKIYVSWKKKTLKPKLFKLPVSIKLANFPKTYYQIKVHRKYVKKIISPKLKKKIRQQWQEYGKSFRSRTEKQWQGPFLDARNLSPITSHFYTQRYYNGRKGGVHSGVDLKGAYGAPIRAMNSGTIVLSAKQYYNGNIVIIDHGHGIFTLYKHMLQRNVKKGDKVIKGQLIGSVGSTGISTGPHLHLSLYIQGQVYSPLSLLALPILEDE